MLGNALRKKVSSFEVDPAIRDLNRDPGEARVVMQETASATKDLKKSFGLDAPGKPPGEQTL